MNNCFITLQMLGISLATFSQLSCATPEEQSGIGKKISTLSAPAISAEERKNIINRFSQGLEEDDCKYYKEKVISAVEKIYAEHLVEFEAAVDRFSQGMYPYQKVCVIEAIAKIPAERLTPAFEVAVSRLSQGMQGQMKAEVISSVRYLAAERLTTLMNAFTPEVMLQLAIVPDYDRINLIRKLMRLESGLWSAEITEIINQYRHNNVVDQPNIAFEVHNYANTQVTTTSSSGALNPSSRSPSPMRLDDAVMQNMNQRLQTANVPSMAFADAKALLGQWIQQKYSNSSVSSSELERAKHAAFAKLVSDTNYEQVISTAVSFLQQFHSNAVNTWLDGFLRESMNAYAVGGESCSKGIQERVATGMRTIDSDLDKLFAQAEGPALVNKFIGSLNLSDKKRCEAITKELIKLGLNVDSTAAQAGELFERYIRNWFTESGVSADKYLSDIQTMKELVVENGFESYIRPILKKPVYEAERALRAAQDAEYAATLAKDRVTGGVNSSSSSSSAAARVVTASTQLSKEELRNARIKAMEKK